MNVVTVFGEVINFNYFHRINNLWSREEHKSNKHSNLVLCEITCKRLRTYKQNF